MKFDTYLDDHADRFHDEIGIYVQSGSRVRTTELSRNYWRLYTEYARHVSIVQRFFRAWLTPCKAGQSVAEMQREFDIRFMNNIMTSRRSACRDAHIAQMVGTPFGTIAFSLADYTMRGQPVAWDDVLALSVTIDKLPDKTFRAVIDFSLRPEARGALSSLVQADKHRMTPLLLH